MIAALTAAAVALAVGLPIFALGETLRDRAESAMKIQNTSSTRKDA
nr:MAG TPA: hypothetical protein [Caudoviricetes sp.]